MKGSGEGMDTTKRRMLAGDIGILLVALIWGATNVVIRGALSDITPFWFCTLRFIIASAALMLLFGRRAFAVPARLRIAGIFTGAVFCLAYLAGAVGLLYTTAGNQSFIISMSVVFVPLSVWLLTRKFPGWYVILSVVLCAAGMCGLMLDGNMTVNLGDLLSFAAMWFVTAYILLVQKYAADADPIGLACWQSIGVAVLAAAVSVVFEPVPQHISSTAWAAIIYAGTVGFALTLVLQTAAQKYTTPTHAAILLSTSGIFGSLIGIIFIGEPMTWRIFTASALILAGVLMVEAVPALGRR